jgi:hypothetical protein
MGDELTPLKIEAIEKETKAFDCPSCGAHLQFLVCVSVVGVHEAEQPQVRVKAPKVPPPKPKMIYPATEIAKSTGIYDAFVTTMKTSTPHNVPADLERYFSMWLKRSQKVKTPQFAIRPCLEAAEREGDLELYAFQNIAAVVRDGYLHSFLPYQFVKGQSIAATLAANGNGIQKTEHLSLPQWIKTRNGYVAGKGALFQELRGKAAGDFASTGI